ncbi:serine/threonine-protein kinase pelle isoform X1 [Megalopta genalis]|uniref:serine/threonine-protein kinase pelle isoform X1 n=1 Tax=Megalopta genalis TaxID=115081 RepID=UPI001442F6B5|nr:pelle-like serine/threonine-protein kinase pik-1 isoform X1 [Megalopta genalis]XP_033338902.1 pelle-like serine/threonine-protein kinase pik-1 isoform X1 [Megalopta genalis]
MSSSSSVDKVKYIYQLPFFERLELCKMLNQHDKWEELAGIWMGYDVLTIQSLRKEKNPTDELLTIWGHHNHTILELFVLLSKMQHYQSMIPLKPFVDEKFHKLIYDGEGNLHRILGKRLNKNTKDLKIGTQNFNQVVPPQPNVPKIVIEPNTKEASYKILNQPMQAEQVGITPSNSNNLLVASVAAPYHLPGSSKHNPVNGENNNDAVLPCAEITLPHASYDELSVVTNDWNKINVLGRGGFGTVYRGIWKNTDVAIKKIEKRGANSDESYVLQLQQSLREIQILNRYPHENILPLYAYSLGGKAPCLVYQLMKNGSVEDRLLIKQKCQPLSWIQRHGIAKGTARGLQYLHTIGKKPLIHGDIKSANILLDKNFEPRIGDFGLAREGPEKDSMKVSKIHGTRPYLPEEFLYGRKLSTKVDTYSFGIVLFELATGLPAYDDSRSENKFLKDFIDHWHDRELHLLIDKKAGEKDRQVYNNLILLGKWCANRMAQNRPEMDIVFKKLNDL